MDKIFKLFVCLGLLAGGVGFTQTYEVYNKFGSDGIYEIQDDGKNLGENASGFGGLYNIAFGLINMPLFSAQAEYRLDLNPDFTYKNYRFSGNAIKANVLQGVASTRKNIELRKKDISRQEEEIDQKIRNVPQYERELTDIMRQQRIKENLFVFLLEKREENALTQTLAVGDARMIDEPTSAGVVAPQKNKIFLKINKKFTNSRCRKKASIFVQK